MRFLLLLLLMANPYLKTDSTQLERDYRWPDDLRPVVAGIQADPPWVTIAPGTRRRTFFNDRLTLVVLEITGQNGVPLTLHYHVHDQITYVLEGKGLVQVGAETREVEAGGAYVAPSNVHHGLAPRSDRLVIVECFTPTREDFRDAPAPRARSVNEVKSLVYHLFSLLDRQAPTPADFRRHYATPGTVEQVDARPEGAGWRVDFTLDGRRQSWLLDADLTIRTVDSVH